MRKRGSPFLLSPMQYTIDRINGWHVVTFTGRPDLTTRARSIRKAYAAAERIAAAQPQDNHKQHLEQISAPAAHLDNYLPDLRKQMTAYGNARYRQGFAHAERLVSDMAVWLTLDPPPTATTLRQWLLAAHEREAATLPPAG